MVKLDMGAAWNSATAMIGANKDVLLIVAGVFFFLPNVAATLLMPQSAELAAMQANPNPDPEAVFAQLGAFYADIWWVFLIMGLAQAIGVLGLLALLTDRTRPTVGEALSFGLRALLPYLATQIIVGVILLVGAAVLIGGGAAIHPGAAALGALIFLVGFIYLWVKFSLVSPVMAIENVLNPIAALKRSWQLTKGNSLRIFAFFMLLILVLLVISVIVGLALGLFALAGEQIGLIVSALGGGLVNMAFVVIMLAVLAAIHRQLSGGGNVSETFE